MSSTSLVLIVDDEPASLQTVASMLEGEGYQLETASNGAQALAKAQACLPDVILLDVMMPGMTGYEVCRALRNSTALAEIPVLFLSGLDDRDSFLRGLEAGADEFLTKPYDRYQLRTRLRTLARLNRFRKLAEARPALRVCELDR